MSGRFMKMVASGLRGGMGKAVSIQYRVQQPVGRKVPMVVKAVSIGDPLRTGPIRVWYQYGGIVWIVRGSVQGDSSPGRDCRDS